MSVVGTIQNGILNELAQGSRSSNGFIDRLLFVIANNQDKQAWSDKEPSFDIEASWAEIIGRLVDMPYKTDEDGKVIPTIIGFSPDAKARLYQWQRENTEDCNREENDALKGVLSKFDFHAIRFCLIIQMARWACGEADKTEIDLVSVENAISLVDYFKATATRVQGIIKDFVKRFTGIHFQKVRHGRLCEIMIINLHFLHFPHFPPTKMQVMQIMQPKS